LGRAVRLEQARKLDPVAALKAFVQLAKYRIDFIQTAGLDRAVQQIAAHPDTLDRYEFLSVFSVLLQ
jgi:hypothetical protein